jgi:NADH-quinone oxidoreductase subunit J
VVQALAFYLFAGVLLLSAVLVISSRNPVHSVLWLILGFFNASGLFLLLGAEFLAMILVIVYVGAVAVLFLFVVMMLDINFTELRQGFLRYLPIGLLVAAVLLAELLLVGGAWTISDRALTMTRAATPNAEVVSNTVALGRLIYTDYILVFQAAGLILLVAMIGAIVLTHRSRPGVKRQNIAAQVARQPDEAFDTVKVDTGKGVEL